MDKSEPHLIELDGEIGETRLLEVGKGASGDGTAVTADDAPQGIGGGSAQVGGVDGDADKLVSDQARPRSLSLNRHKSVDYSELTDCLKSLRL